MTNVCIGEVIGKSLDLEPQYMYMIPACVHVLSFVTLYSVFRFDICTCLYMYAGLIWAWICIPVSRVRPHVI